MSSSPLPFRPVSQQASNLLTWCRNINLPSIDYAFRPRLRVRLTLGGFTFPRKPQAFGERDSHPFYRYSFLHDHLCFVQGSLSVPLRSRTQRSPTVKPLRILPAASVSCLVPFIIGAGLLDQ